MHSSAACLLGAGERVPAMNNGLYKVEFDKIAAVKDPGARPSRPRPLVEAIGTPFGRYGGALASVRTDDLGAIRQSTGRSRPPCSRRDVVPCPTTIAKTTVRPAFNCLDGSARCGAGSERPAPSRSLCRCLRDRQQPNS